MVDHCYFLAGVHQSRDRTGGACSWVGAIGLNGPRHMYDWYLGGESSEGRCTAC